MEFDWLDVHFDLKQVGPKEIAESFEDPFAIRLLPDAAEYGGAEARYFNLGRTLASRGIFSVFWTDGKNYRVILAREFTTEEQTFYERKNAEML
ncbi:MAG TPA: BrnT family toxin [Verrucomicrobiales bacterium]|nr:BrnT family toxin [Verrucomicrobiae bacterium]MCC6882693.1 BrnT family toxin [Verrucomicrobiales bacterium]MCP5553660.1 BrnT family toxin [Akkermansiaceae bacterium]HRX53131.1 BrnT family toxin [Verrucomicrobiales bacterium]